MGAPWEKYQTPSTAPAGLDASGPWTKYGGASEEGAPPAPTSPGDRFVDPQGRYRDFAGPVPTSSELDRADLIDKLKNNWMTHLASAVTDPESKSANPLRWELGAADAGLGLVTGIGAGLGNEVLSAGGQALLGKDPGNVIPSYSPRTPEGRDITRTLGAVAEPVGQAVDMAAKGWGKLAALPASPENQPRIEGAVEHGLKAASYFAPGPAGKIEREAVPTADALKASAQASFERAKGTGEVAMQRQFDPLIKDVETYLTDKGYRPGNNPQTAQQLKDLYDEATNPKVVGSSMTGIDSLRKALRNSEDTAYAASQPGKTSPDAMMASEVVDKFDDWVDKNFPESSAAGQEARQDWRKYRNSETIQGLFDRAEIKSKKYTQSGLDNALRDQFANLANNPRRMKYFNADEQQAIRDAATGSITQRAARRIGALLSPHSTGGLAVDMLMASFAGHSLGGPVGGALGLAAAGAGVGSKALATRLRVAAANRARDTAALGRAPKRGVALLPGAAAYPLIGAASLPPAFGVEQP